MGKVIRQTPEAGTPVKKGDTVTYIVSQGVETVPVPNVTNRSEADARAILTDAGFPAIDTTTEYHDTIPEGCVIRQSPDGGIEREKGAAITLVISMGRKTSYYSYYSTFNKPLDSAGDVAVGVAYSAQLTAPDGSEIPVAISDNGDSIVVSASNIENISSGTLTIYWEWIEPEVVDEETGDIISPAESKSDVTGPLNVSFQQQ